jgi:hypothetical protein
LDEVSNGIAEIAAHYMHEIGVLSGMSALFTAIVFGWCLRENRFRAFQLSPQLERDAVSVTVTEQDLISDENLIVIGSCPNLLRERISQERPGFYAGETDAQIVALREIDLPKRVLQFLINEQADPSVGGALQYGWATRFGFSPASIMTFIDPPLPNGRNAAMTVLGFDLHNFRQLGSYVFALAGRI